MSRPVIAFRILSIVLLLLCVNRHAGAQPVPGDVVFLQDPNGSLPAAVMTADQTTGNRTVVSEFGVRGSGPDFNFTIGGIDLGPNGELYVSGSQSSTILRIDPTTGDRTIISSATIGTGPAFNNE